MKKMRRFEMMVVVVVRDWDRIEIGDNVGEGVAIVAEIDRLDRYLETCNDIIGRTIRGQ